MTGDFTNPRQWSFPDISIEPQHGYLLVWTDGDQAQGALHNNFRLDRNSEQLGIFESDLLGNAPIDTFSYGTQQADTSFGRYPDASEQWEFMPPTTPGNTNKTFTGVSVSENFVPDKFELWQNYPNPFNPQTQIKFALPELAQVSLIIYNISGQRIKTLVDKKLSADYHTFYWDGTDEMGMNVSSGRICTS